MIGLYFLCFTNFLICINFSVTGVMQDQIHFEKASTIYQEVIFEWLEEPHVIEFWDNSQEYKDDIRIFIDGRKVPSPYYSGMFDYWVGLIDQTPFCLVMTSIISPHEEDLAELFRQHLSKNGKTISIDFMIGDKEFLGKGLAAPTLRQFTRFFHTSVDTTADTFIIDPNIKNPRAKHVYEKAGFKNMGEFERRGERFFLMVKSEQ